MAHFAELNNDNVVQRVVVVDNSKIIDENGDEQESLGVSFLQNLYGADTIWKQTSYNKTFRGWFAGEGFVYNADDDMFRPPFPTGTPSYVWSDEEYTYIPPVPHPEKPNYVEGNYWIWNEQEQHWALFQWSDSEEELVATGDVVTE